MAKLTKKLDTVALQNLRAHLAHNEREIQSLTLSAQRNIQYAHESFQEIDRLVIRAGELKSAVTQLEKGL